MTSRLPRLLAAVLAVCILAGCAGVSAGTIPAGRSGGTAAPLPAGSSATPPAAPLPANNPGATATLRPAPAKTATPGPSPTPTPDLRLPPEDWRDWPVAPLATGRAVDIYRAGQALGNDPHRFSKVGDCQAIREVLMGMFDRPGSYALKPERERLKPAIEYFQGSFNRDGMAVQGGFNAASVLSPMWANPELCQPGENPLECEYRLHKPSFVIISLEVWWDGRTPERYEQYMRRIIEFSIEKGIVPILSTKADNVEGDHAINLATARLAYEYDLPLWNWWRAAQELPNGGLDPYRPDGFHISYAAWAPRAFTALEALDSVWRGVDPDTAVTPTVSATPSPGLPGEGAGGEVSLAEPFPFPLPSLTPLPFRGAAGGEVTPSTPTVSATPSPGLPGEGVGGEVVLAEPLPSPHPFKGGAGGEAPPSDQILFGLTRRAGETVEPGGVFRIDLASGGKTELAGPGWQFQAVSPQGSHLLLNRGAELVLTDAAGLNPVRLSSAFFAAARQGAVFTGPSSLAFIARGGDNTYVIHYPLDGSDWQALTSASDHPVELYPSGQDGQARWGGGVCDTGGCRVDTLAVSAPGQPTARQTLRAVLDPTQAARTATPAGAGQAPGALGAPAGALPAWSPDSIFSAYTQSVNGDKSALILAAVGRGTPRLIDLPGSYPVDLLFNPAGDRLAVLQLDRSEYSGRWGAIHTVLLNPANLGVQALPDAPRGLNPRALFSTDGRSLLLASTYPDIEGRGSQVLVYRAGLSSAPAQDLTALFGLSSTTDILLVSNWAWLPAGSAALGPAPIPRETP